MEISSESKHLKSIIQVFYILFITHAQENSRAPSQTLAKRK